MSTRGLYASDAEHDSCGFGMIARVGGTGTRALMDDALAALSRMTHRGGVAADGLSGDGCGVLAAGIEDFARLLAAEAGLETDPGRALAVGMVFLPDDDTASGCMDALERRIADEGLECLGWREVPIDTSVCGELARATLPRIRQVFVQPAAGHADHAAFDRALYLARLRCERELAGTPDFHVVGMARGLLGYKGMVLPQHLATLYPDLRRGELAARAVLFHQRFSTNTLPRWKLAHPFRRLAHNGEINSIEGNRRWARARGGLWRSPVLDMDDIGSPVSMHGSDSQSLDSALEWLLAGGMDLPKALRILMPPATQSLEFKDTDLAGFYEYHGLNSEPWDGPAGVVACDGRHAACTLDRNGLRPARWILSDDGRFLIASETGVWDIAPERVAARGKLGPGEMIAVDLAEGRLLDNEAIDDINRRRAPYREWLKRGLVFLHTELIDPRLSDTPFAPDTLAGFQKLFQHTREEIEHVLRPLAETEQEGIGSMGDDVPMAVLSRQVRPLYDAFREAFAQVTNPPIDPLREAGVMTLVTQIGREGNLFVDAPENVNHVVLNSPVLSQRKFHQLLAMPRFAEVHRYLDLQFDAGETLAAAIDRLCAEAEDAARAGMELLVLSDRRPRPEATPVHALLATGAIHARLVETGLRCGVNLIVETGTARDPHHFACLIGHGATAVYPYLAYQTLHALREAGVLGGNLAGETGEYGRSYRRGIRKGLLKILSKMGIANIASYRGAGLFEIVGLADEVVARCFPGTPSRIGGAGFARLEADARQLAAEAWDPLRLPAAGGLMRWIHGGEYHQYHPEVVMSLQRAVRSGTREDWREYRRHVDERPSAALRDLLELVPPGPALPLDEVEPVEAIVRRFDSAAMSLGALSPEAHEALAIAMNRLGGRSNSGEGGEDPARHHDERRSAIKQIASGRFGVTPAYLVNADVLQIKMAQGAKPGEGGQLPGNKVDALIARLRHARPGIGLISPPPHHDIYSIEDLAQLVFDLRQVNPRALVSVKLVAHAGVGTIAAGAVKAGADMLTISGHDGGTGASPLGSIRYAGVPWELGLSEARQALQANGLRGQVIVQADGGLKTGLDVIKAAILGADSFGFGTAPMIALGCKYLRICHLNNCATGVATQDARLREAHFRGLPERVECFFRNVAEDVREWLAVLGARTLDEIIGRTELLRQIDAMPRGHLGIDLSRLLETDASQPGRHRGEIGPKAAPGPLAEYLERQLADAIETGTGAEVEAAIGNTDRSIGAALSGRIALRHGDGGMPGAPLAIRLTGVAGQSFGAFNAPGLNLELEGEANDYVGKGMAGGRIVIRPFAGSRLATERTPILGNTCLYGATGGELFAAGRAGERFAVRNSGALAVVEGAGEHCCEYMTGGVVAVLGRTGGNFGAGFTGGIAYVLDMERDFVDRCNPELIDILRISPEGMEHHRHHLHDLIMLHHQHTGSAWSARLLDDFRDLIGRFWLVKPKAASLESLAETLRRAA